MSGCCGGRFSLPKSVSKLLNRRKSTQIKQCKEIHENNFNNSFYALILITIMYQRHTISFTSSFILIFFSGLHSVLSYELHTITTFIENDLIFSVKSHVSVLEAELAQAQEEIHRIGVQKKCNASILNAIFSKNKLTCVYLRVQMYM